MALADIHVDLFNPGQVFACLGFLEAADVLIGDAEGGFDWSDDAQARFRLTSPGDRIRSRSCYPSLLTQRFAS